VTYSKPRRSAGRFSVLFILKKYKLAGKYQPFYRQTQLFPLCQKIFPGTLLIPIPRPIIGSVFQGPISPGQFSFNVAVGRCFECEGDGVKQIEMQFLSDVYVQCDECKGKRYNSETLSVLYKGKNISDILNMTVYEALQFFENIPAIKRKLQTIFDVGLGYIKLGQSSTTLSGGEAQRVKLASELSKRGTGKTLYILDEPTTGLHFADVQKLLDVLNRLVNLGNTVIVIEHNMDVIRNSDWIIDLGPEGGDKGGEIVTVGAPEQILKNQKSYTGQYLKKFLKK